MTQELGREPLFKELSKRIGFSEREIDEYYSMDVKSLDERVSEDGEESFGNLLPDEKIIPFEKQLEKESLHRLMENIICKMPEKYQLVIKERFGFGGNEPKTLDMIGKELGLTGDHIRQIETRAMYYFRMPNNVKLLKEYLG